ncbi:efflux RND transporter permease subunit [Burkholderia oklahomensis]|uniref:efflux RND transporter permease subunit n=4 Tax=Burkholderia oklahomensis TaxID=342113 RepID=UPI0005D9ED3D|nr:efflux RND transporter permease subunit [Burkholderia oklahomensis]AJX31660.1 MMPL family protein [Burkholderia oklahomensis C6786]MBI0358232.1 efflux RND transporter permease subunit [Burkholderia oklahomensis]SUW56160.1 Multidrug transporter MdtC [Burkholderia oklahomensis]
MNFLAWSIRRPLPTILLFALLCVGGAVGFRALPVAELPSVDAPVVTIDASLPGATPSQVEREITRPIEQGVAGIGAARRVLSRVTDGRSHTTIQFALEADPRDALERVRAAVGRLRGSLPPDMPEPVVAQERIERVLLTYAASSARLDPVDLSWFVDSTLSKALLAVPGVARVERQGGVDRQIDVALNPVALQALRIDAGDVAQQVRARLADTPAARIDVGGRAQSVRMENAQTSVAELGALDLSLGDGRRVTLADIAAIDDAFAPPKQIALLDGRPVVGVQVMQAPGADEVRVAQGVRDAIETLRRAHPGIDVRGVADYVAPIQRVFDGAMSALYEGCVLAVLIVWLFLRDWRATLVSASALPLSILPAFLAMAWLGFSLNQLTMLALILVIGVLVDDAIVEVENIARHLGDGKPPFAAALDGAREIGVAVIATSLTLVAVFLPTAFMNGAIGRYFKQFGWTAAAAVLASLVVARLLTPMMSAYCLRRAPPPRGESRTMRGYLACVRWCVARPWRCLFFGAAFVCASVAALASLPKAFLPAQDRAEIVVGVRAPPGSDLDATRAAVEAARRAAAGVAGIASIYATIGDGSASGGGAADSAVLTVALTPPGTRTRSQAQVEAELARRFAAVPGVRFTVGDKQTDKVASMVLSSRDGALLERTARGVERALRAAPGLGAVGSTAGARRPAIGIAIDGPRAAALGVTREAAGDALRIATMGDAPERLPRLDVGSRQVPVRVHAAPGAPGAPGADDGLSRLFVPGRDGSVPLSSVARLTEDSEPAQIDRRDGERYVTLDIGLAGRPLGDVIAQVDRLPEVRDLPAGVRRIASGDAESLDELFGGFYYAMLFGLACVYAILVLLFGGFVLPATVLVALPLSLGGAAALLALCGLSLSLASLVGLLMLMGLCTKNSILLVQYVIVARERRRLSRVDAIVDACRKRARPIAMTTFAMMAGLLPLAFDAQGDVFRSAMAITVIGGLVTSTALSLLLVPVAFVVLDGVQAGLSKRFAPRVGEPARGDGGLDGGDGDDGGDGSDGEGRGREGVGVGDDGSGAREIAARQRIDEAPVRSA